MAAKPTKRAKKTGTSDVIVTEEMIIITLPPEEAAKAKARLRESGVAKFKIKEIEVKAIPIIRPGDHPVSCP